MGNTAKTIGCAITAITCLSITGRAADKPVVEPSTSSRAVACQQEDVVKLATQVNYATLIQFAPTETVVGAFWGDTERWSVDTVKNMLVVKPSVKGTGTDLHIITSSGQVCSFALREVSNDVGLLADLKVQITTPNVKPTDKPVFYSAQQVGALNVALDEAQKALAAEKIKESERVETEKEAVRIKTEASIKHSYVWDQNHKGLTTFGVKSIYEMGGWTYIEAAPQESPALYEKRDGKPSIVQYTLKNGVYVVPKIIDAGYMKVGKSYLNFRKES